MAGLREVAKNAGVTVDVARSLFAAVATMLGAGANSVKIKGFGSFQIKTIPRREVASPAILDGQPFIIQEQLNVKFTLAPAAKHRINLMYARRRRAAAATADAMSSNPKKRAVRPRSA